VSEAGARSATREIRKIMRLFVSTGGGIKTFSSDDHKSGHGLLIPIYSLG